MAVHDVISNTTSKKYPSMDGGCGEEITALRYNFGLSRLPNRRVLRPIGASEESAEKTLLMPMPGSFGGSTRDMGSSRHTTPKRLETPQLPRLDWCRPAPSHCLNLRGVDNQPQRLKRGRRQITHQTKHCLSFKPAGRTTPFHAQRGYWGNHQHHRASAQGQANNNGFSLPTIRNMNRTPRSRLGFVPTLAL